MIAVIRVIAMSLMPSFFSADSVPRHGDLYEQIDQLEAIDMDELVKLLADTDDNEETTKTPVSLAEFF